MINDGYLQHVRVGASAGLAVKYLARKDAAVVGMLGSGGMARSRLVAFAAVREIEKANVFSPHKEHRETYAREMSKKLGFEVVSCQSAEKAAKGVDILSTCTNSVQPTLFGDMLEPGMHLTAVANKYAEEVYPRIDVCVGGGPRSQVAQGIPIDRSKGFTTYLAGSMEALQNARAGNRPRDRHPDFRGRVVALPDLLEVKEAGLGRPVPVEWFLQDFRD